MNSYKPNKSHNPEDMDKFLDSYNHPILDHEEKENLNRLINSKEIKSVIKNLSTDRSLLPDMFTGEFYQMFRESIAVLLKHFQKTQRRKAHSNSL